MSSAPQGLKADEARKATRTLPPDKKALLRDAGKRKFEEFKKKRQLLQASGLLNAGTTAQGLTTVAKDPVINVSPSPAPQDPFSPTSQDGAQVDFSHSSSDKDPLTDMLIAQVNTLMQEKRSLLTENENLKRDLEQLQELVGYLSLLQEEGAADYEGADDIYENDGEEGDGPSFIGLNA